MEIGQRERECLKRSIEERIKAPGTEARIEKKPRLSGEIKTFSYIWK